MRYENSISNDNIFPKSLFIHIKRTLVSFKSVLMEYNFRKGSNQIQFTLMMIDLFSHEESVKLGETACSTN